MMKGSVWFRIRTLSSGLGARAGVRTAARRIVDAAEAERRRLLQEAEIAAREEALAARAAGEAELRARAEEQARAEVALAARAVAVEEEGSTVAEVKARVEARESPVRAREGEVSAARDEVAALAGQARAALERGAGAAAAVLATALSEAELDEARGRAAQLLRVVGGDGGPEQMRQAKRIMGIAVGRFAGHYLTERHLSVVPVAARPELGEDELRAIEEVLNGVKLAFTDARDGVRLEGLDGVGREVARRALYRIARGNGDGNGNGNGRGKARSVARAAADEVGRELDELGRRAFEVLEIPRAHPEIVVLVGRLNFRTSYTQNQWKHAVEAGFLCGMMADELGLDRRVARRAALLHDIGKALTHELDGSHAVIGADYARRLGEPEVVANAIGAHHTEEPFASPYAYLVAAADAMSGARPGARRQNEDNHVARLADLERVSRGFPGVEEAFAVQGGREVRVYVREDRVDDLGAVQLSTAIADTISRQMVFPGQIKVTVIREFKAVETAG
jgi:ribonucrease Y